MKMIFTIQSFKNNFQKSLFKQCPNKNVWLGICLILFNLSGFNQLYAQCSQNYSSLSVSSSPATCVEMPNSITFTATSTGCSGCSPEYWWVIDRSGTNVVNVVNTSNTYVYSPTTAGEYTVTVCIRNASPGNSCPWVSAGTHNFSVRGCASSFIGLSGSSGGPNNTCLEVGNNYTFNLYGGTNQACSTAPLTYSWNFGPNATPSTSSASQPNVVFNSTGNQTVTVTTQHCTITRTYNIQASGSCGGGGGGGGGCVISSANVISASPSGPVEQNVSVTFTYTGSTTNKTLTWSTHPSSGASPSSGSGVNFTTSFAYLGTHQVTLNVVDDITGDCTIYFYHQEVVKHVSCVPGGLTISVSGLLVPNSPIDFTATNVSGATYGWTATGGGTISGSGYDVDIWWPSAGTYDVCVNYTNGTCVEQECITVEITNGSCTDPVINISGPSTVCEGDEVTYTISSHPINHPSTQYQWYTSSSVSTPSSGTGVNFTTTFISSGYVQAIGIIGTCVESSSLYVTVNPIPVSGINGPDSICVNSTANFTAIDAGAGAIYSWESPGGTPSSGTGLNFSPSYSGLGVHFVTLEVTKSGCTETYLHEIDIKDYPNSGISGNSTGCPGNNITFSANPAVPGATYSWSVTGGSPSTGNSNLFTTSFASNGTYTINLLMLRSNQNLQKKKP